jgi:hypothetical protein
MDRGLLVQLSPSEELTLGRVAHGLADAKDLRSSDLSRLRTLALIDDGGGGLRITRLGLRRLAARQSAQTDTTTRPIDKEIPSTLRH